MPPSNVSRLEPRSGKLRPGPPLSLVKMISVLSKRADFFELLQDLADRLIHCREHGRILASRGGFHLLEGGEVFGGCLDGNMDGIEGEVEKERPVGALLGFDEGRRLVAEGIGEVARFLEGFAVAKDRSGIFPLHVVGGKIDVATAQETKELVEAAIEWSEAGPTAEVPLPDHAGDVTGRFEPLRQGHHRRWQWPGIVLAADALLILAAHQSGSRRRRIAPLE